MGLTTFPSGLDQASKLDTWEFVKANADLIALHYDEIGLPWEALERNEIPASFNERFEEAASLSAGRIVYAAITPLDALRQRPAIDASGGPFPAVLGPALFSNPRLRQAFRNYARFIVDTLDTRYLALGIEVNLYELANPEDFPSLVSLYTEVYQELKAVNPALIIFPTFQLEGLIEWDQFSLLSLFDPEMDRIGLALYPSSVGFRPVELPDDYISRVLAFCQHPLVITETGYGSEPFSGSTFSAPASYELQREYLQWLFDQAEELSLDFMVWFFATDIPYILPSLTPETDFFRFFVYMGLARSDFTSKPMTFLWNENLCRPLQTLP